MTTRRVHPHEHHFQPQPEHPEGTVHHVDPLTVIEAEQLKQKIAEAKRMTLDKLMSSFSAENLKKFWKDLFESDVAKASAMWSLMSSLLPTLSIYFLYVFFLTIVGPRMMRKRNPVALKTTLILFNILQIASSGWIIFRLCKSGWLLHYFFRCGSLYHAMVEESSTLFDICWFYFICKFFNLFDTVALVLQKRFDDISVTNVFYEGFVLVSVWFTVRLMPGGHFAVFMFIETSVQLLTNLYCVVRWNLQRVKSKTLLMLHMFRTIAILTHAVELSTWNSCNFPRAFVWVVGVHAILLVLLFKSKCTRCWRFKEVKRVAHNDEVTECNPHDTSVTYRSFGADYSTVTRRNVPGIIPTYNTHV